MSLLLFASCEHSQITDEDPVETTPDYKLVREAYNKKILPLKQMRSSMNMQLSWKDENGRGHFEDGSGLIIYRYPRDLALTLGKAGHTLFWFGSNKDEFWILDLRKPKSAQIGKHQKEKLSTVEGIPLPIDGQIFRTLLHLQKLPINEPKSIKQKAGLINMVWEKSPAWGGHDIIITLRAENYQMAHLTLMKADKIVLKANFYKETLSVENDQTPITRWPDIPKRFDVHFPEAKAKAKISFYKPNSNAKKITNDQFDLDLLLELNEIKNYKQLK